MNIWNIILNIAWIIFGFIALYFRTKTTIIDDAVAKIGEAEEAYKDAVKAGSQKQEFVVSAIYDHIPAPMRIIFTKETIRGLVQQVFDGIARYATQELDKIFKKDKEDKIEEK